MKTRKAVIIVSVFTFLIVVSAIAVACSLFDSSPAETVQETDWTQICEKTVWIVTNNYMKDDDSVPDYFKSITALKFTSSDSVILIKESGELGPLAFGFSGLKDGILKLKQNNDTIPIKAHFSDNMLTLTSPAEKKLYLSKQ